MGSAVIISKIVCKAVGKTYRSSDSGGEHDECGGGVQLTIELSREVVSFFREISRLGRLHVIRSWCLPRFIDFDFISLSNITDTSTCPAILSINVFR